MKKKRVAPLIVAIIVLGALLVFLSRSQVKKIVYTPQSDTIATTSASKPIQYALPVVSVSPSKIIQGDPIMVSISGTSSPASLTLDGKVLKVLKFANKSIAFASVDLKEIPKTKKLVVKFVEGTTLSKDIVVGTRKIIEAPLGIPDKLGGNTPESEKALVDSLVQESAIISGLKTESRALWTEPFQYPIANPIITDIYGYSRQTGAYNLSHKGTDFRALVGTPVLAINSGVVRLVRELRNYGKTIIVDHGLGIMSYYLHLSQINVKEGDVVTKGETIGLSGQTGYVEGPHLHLTIRINDISIDPVTFLNFFNPPLQ